MIGPRMRTAALLAALSLGVAPAALGAAAAPADPVDLGGTPVGRVSTDPGNPTELRAGLWSDTLGASGTAEATHQFSYERTGRDSTVHIGVVASTAEASDQLVVESVIGDTVCDSDTSSPSYGSPGTPFGAAITLQGAEQGDRNSACLTSDVVTFTVARGSGATAPELPVAIKVVEEAPLQDPAEDLPASPDSEPALDLPRPGDADTVRGATSFADAPALEEGTHGDTASEGDTRLYRVSLDWGQTLAVRLDAPAMTPAQEEATGGILGPQLQLTLYDPLRRTLDTHPDADDSGPLDSEDRLRLTDAAGPVRYLSRFASSATFLPGDYWVAVSVQAASDRDPVAVDYELSIGVEGDPAGAPTFSTDDFAKPYLVGADTYSTVASGSPAPAPTDDQDEASGTRRLTALGLGAFGLVCCALGALQLRRR